MHLLYFSLTHTLLTRVYFTLFLSHTTECRGIRMHVAAANARLARCRQLKWQHVPIAI